MKYRFPVALAAAVALLSSAAPALAAETPAPIPSGPATGESQLPAPPNVEATWTEQGLKVSWDVVEKATGYLVTESPDGRTCEVSDGATRSCLLEGLTAGQHTFVVAAFKGSRRGVLSSPVSATVPVRLDKPRFASGRVVIGKSVRGRAIVAERQGNPLAPTVLLVIGQMHGSEPAGLSVVDRVRRKDVPRGADYQIWTVRTMNPDGAAVGNRYNARGVDLNRNFPGNWSASTLRPGRRAASEPETRAMMQFLRKLQPGGVMSFHQPWDTVLSVCDPISAQWVRRVAQLIRLPVPRNVSSCGAWLPGTMSRWFSLETGSWFATVELKPSRYAGPQIPRSAASVLTIAEEMAQAEQAELGVVGTR